MAQSVNNQSTEWAGAIRGVQLREKLRRTGDSVIYRARRSERDYAVRVYQGRADYEPEALERFRRDAAMHAALDHPLIPDSYDVGVVDGHPYIVTDYIDGETLSVWSGTEPFAESMAVVIAGAVAGALAEVHQKGLVHGHVTPESIMLTLSGEIKLVDFGLIRRRPRPKEIPAAERPYVSPERAGLLDHPVDGRSDLYALGVVLYEAVSDRLPGPEGSRAPLQEVTEGISPAFCAIVDRLLEQKPGRRYPSADSLKGDLERLEVLNERHRAGRPLGLGKIESSEEGGRQQFVGRERELERFADLWAEVPEAGGGVLLVEGPSGSGKTRLIDRACRTHVGERRKIIYGRCRKEGAVPFEPLRAGLDRYVGQMTAIDGSPSDQSLERLRRAAEPFEGLLGQVSPAFSELVGGDSSALVPRQAHEVFYNALASLFLQLADGNDGTVLWIDDAQWAGESTLAVLRLLASRVADHSLLLVCSVRTGSREQEPAEAIRQAVAAPRRVRLQLEPFDPSSVGRLIEAELGARQPDGELVDELTRRSRGNPLLLHQQLRTLRDEGLLSPSWRGWRIDDQQLGAIRFSGDPVDWLTRRVDSLPTQMRRILTCAAVIGDSFRLDQLRAVCREQSTEAVHRTLQSAVEVAFLERSADGEGYTFVHDTVQQAFLQRVGSENARRRIRHRAGRWLDGLEGRTVRQLYERARHYMAVPPDRSGRRVRRALREAGERAFEEYAYEDAFVFLSRLDEQYDSESVEDPVALQELLGYACLRTHRLERAVEHLERALASISEPTRRATVRSEIARARIDALDDRAARRQSALAFDELDRTMPSRRWSWRPLAFLWILGRWLVSWAMITLGIGAGRADGAERERCRTRVRLHDIGFHVGYYSRDTLTLLESAVYGLLPAHRLGPGPEYSVGVATYSVALAMLGFDGAAARYGRRAVETAEHNADGQTLGVARQMYGVTQSICGNLDEAIRRERRLLEEDPEWLGALTFNLVCIDLATNYMMRGQVREGYRTTERGLDRLSCLGGASGAIYRTVMSARLAGFAAMQGRFRRADELIEEALAGAEQVEPGRAVPWASVWGFVALVAQQKGEIDETFEEAIDRHEALEIPPERSVHQSKHVYLAEAYGRLADCESGAAGDGGLDRLDEAIGRLEAAATNAALEAHRMALRAGHQRLDRRREAAEATLRQAEGAARADGNVWAEFEAVRQRALLCRDRRREGEAGRQARRALQLAERHGWAHRAAELREQFDLETTADDEPAPRQPDSDPDPDADSGAEPSGEAARAREWGWEEFASMALAVSRQEEPGQMVQQVLASLLGATGATVALLYARQESDQPHFYATGRDEAGFELDEPIECDRSLLEEAFQGNRAVVLPEDEGEASSRCVLALPPILSEQQPFAAIYLEALDGSAVLADCGVDEVLMLGLSATGLIRASQQSRRSVDHRARAETEQILEAVRRLKQRALAGGRSRRTLSDFLEILAETIPFDAGAAVWAESTDEPVVVSVGEVAESSLVETVDQWERQVEASAEGLSGVSPDELFDVGRQGRAFRFPLFGPGGLLGGAVIEREQEEGAFSNFDREVALLLAASLGDVEVD